MYEDLTWSVPNENNEGYVVDQQTNKVLGVDGENNLGSKVMLQTKENPENLNQKWKRDTNEEGFFILRNLKSGLCLNNDPFSWDDPFELEFPTIESMYLF